MTQREGSQKKRKIYRDIFTEEFTESGTLSSDRSAVMVRKAG